MINKRGFTLVEVLAVIAILSVLLLIAVPSITKVMENNKKRTFLEDAKRFLSVVESKMESDTSIEYPQDGGYIVFPLEYFNEKDFNISPYGTTYSEKNSFVALKNDSSTMEYYVYMTACEQIEVINHGEPNEYKGINCKYIELTKKSDLKIDSVKSGSIDLITKVSTSDTVYTGN